MTRPCHHPGICQSRACADCPRTAPSLPYRTDADPPPSRGERVVQILCAAAWAVCVVVWVRVKRGSQMHLREDCEYRITDPDAHIINAPGTPFHGLEGPMRKSPMVNEQYWVLGAVGSWIWGGDSNDTAWLSQGRAFRTKAAREAWEAAHIKFTMGDE